MGSMAPYDDLPVVPFVQHDVARKKYADMRILPQGRMCERFVGP